MMDVAWKRELPDPIGAAIKQTPLPAGTSFFRAGRRGGSVKFLRACRGWKSLWDEMQEATVNSEMGSECLFRWLTESSSNPRQAAAAATAAAPQEQEQPGVTRLGPTAWKTHRMASALADLTR